MRQVLHPLWHSLLAALILCLGLSAVSPTYAADSPVIAILDMEHELISRAESNPKPMYYSETFLRDRLKSYLESNNLDDADSMDPDDFARWIFPELVKHRRPLYQRLADKYGYTIEAKEAEQVHSEADFLELVETAIARSATA